MFWIAEAGLGCATGVQVLIQVGDSRADIRDLMVDAIETILHELLLHVRPGSFSNDEVPADIE
jgi:hypothetical protein